MMCPNSGVRAIFFLRRPVSVDGIRGFLGKILFQVADKSG